MSTNLPRSVSFGQPESVVRAGYRPPMEKTAKQVLRENVLELLQKDAKLVGKETGVTRLVKLGLSNGNAQRVLDSSEVGTERLDQLARVFGLSAWQLLVPGLDPKQPPTLGDELPPWPFHMVEASRYWALSQEDRAFVQAKLDAAIEDREARRPARAKQTR